MAPHTRGIGTDKADVPTRPETGGSRGDPYTFTLSVQETFNVGRRKAPSGRHMGAREAERVMLAGYEDGNVQHMGGGGGLQTE